VTPGVLYQTNKIPSKLSQAIKDCGDLTHANTKTIKSDTHFIRHKIDYEKHTKQLS
jgi:hypothetical protein